MAKLKPNERRVQLSFLRPEDVALYERLEAMAYDRRYDLSTFLILALTEAFPLPEENNPFIEAEREHANFLSERTKHYDEVLATVSDTGAANPPASSE